MTDDSGTFKGADLDTLITVAREAVTRLCDKDVEMIQPDDDGDIVCTGESAGLIIHADTEPSALIFKTYLLDGIKESPALYALINEINADISIGQVYFNCEANDIRYYYKYLAEAPTVDLVVYILSTMIDIADLYDDRLKTRLGGERFIERAEDEIEV